MLRVIWNIANSGTKKLPNKKIKKKKRSNYKEKNDVVHQRSTTRFFRHPHTNKLIEGREVRASTS